MGRRDLVDIMKEGPAGVIPEPTGEEFIDGVQIRSTGYRREIEKGGNFGGKNQALLILRVVQGLNAEGITGQHNRRIFSIQDGKAEHANEPRQQSGTPFLPA